MKRAFIFSWLWFMTIVLTCTMNLMAQDTSQVPAFPNDMSVAGLQAMTSETGDSTIIEGLMAPEVLRSVREYSSETEKAGAGSRSGVLSISAAPTNVRANNPAGDAIGETQSEVAVAVFGDTVVIGWNDSKGFTAGFTVSSYAYSIDGGATFVDGGNVPLQAAADQAFGDPGIATDEKGNWYYNQIYTKPGQQNIGVHHGKFVAGVLVWDTPVMASIGTGASGLLDKCLIAADPVTGNVYDAYTRFTAIPRIEVVRSTDLGVTWGAPIVLDATITPTASKQAARPFCGPNGEVYVVWEKGANTINCPDGSGMVANTTGVIGFARSLNNGVSYDPFISIGTVNHSWTWSGPGDLRERANDFPDIGVDRSGGPFNGNIYVTWHESAPWTSNLSAGPAVAEANNAANNNPGGAEAFTIGDNATGSSSSTADLDYWQFQATQGQSLLFNLDPQGFNCGVSGTTRGLRMRLFATQSPYPNPAGFPDTLLAASALGTFAQRIVWTAPKSGTYLVRIQPSTVAIGTYTLRVRNLAFGAPDPARDARDVVVVRSTDQGASWSAEQRVNDDPAGLENRRPFISADGLGNVHVFWHDSRTPGFGSNAALTSIFGTSSLDGGSTWSPNYQVTDELSFFSFNTLAVPNLGDYNQAAATSTGIVHPAWSDQRISTGDVRIPGSNAYSAGRGPETYTTAFALPEITCPANITTQSDPNVCGAVVNYSVFAKGTPAPTVISTPASGSTFPIGTTTVTNSASNGFGVTVTCSFTVTVVDTQKPSISALSVNPASLWPPNHTMRDVAVSYAASDNCPGTTSALSVTSSEPVNGTGDGDSSPDWEIVDATHVRLRAERSGTGPGRVYTVTVTSTDASGNVTVASTSVVVSHNISDPFSGTAVKVGTPVTFGGTFWDIAGRTHSAFWNLDALTAAGVVTEPSGLKSGSVRGSYAFSSAGVYRMKLSIKDDLGGVSSVNTNGDREAMIVVYDPSAGYTVGGGWFASPAGAYPAKPSATGKASFAFTSKYFKNASNPKGEALFQFAAGSLDFSALNYSYLALSGGKATFKGFGKLNDDASYNFMLTAIDGQLMNPIGPDRIHMRIWNKNTGAVVYDNQLNPDPSELTSTPVGDGSNIVITTTSIAGTTGEQPETAEEGGDPAASGSTDDVPKEYGLRQNYPNPFNPATTIGFDLPEDSKVSLVIYNSLGEEIRRLVDGSRSAGRYAPAWDGLNGRGHPVVSGIYFYRLTAVPVSGGEPFVRVMKAIFMK